MALAPLNIDEIIRRVDAGESLNAVAADVGVSERTIRNRLNRAGLPLASSRSRGRRRSRLDDAVWLRELHLNQSQSASTVAHRLGVSTADVRVLADTLVEHGGDMIGEDGFGGAVISRWASCGGG